jgi:Zn-dependent protease with chaperone function
MVQKVVGDIISSANLSHLDWEVCVFFYYGLMIEFHRNVIESPEVNAFVLPGTIRLVLPLLLQGGKIFVFTGILKVTQNEAGLAAVLGHEIAHQVARHSAEKSVDGHLAYALLIPDYRW